jgi:hypothetical protein
MDMLDDVEFEIRKLALGPEDILVVRTKTALMHVHAVELRARLERMINHKVLVIDPGTELSVVSKTAAPNEASTMRPQRDEEILRAPPPAVKKGGK